MPDITLDRVSKVYPGGATALSDITLSLAAGECVAVVGPSGCGKTTLLRLVAGLEEPTAGEVKIGGRIVSRIPPQDRDVSLMPQGNALYPQFTVRENLAFGLRFRAVPPAEIAKRVNDTAGMLELTALLDRLPHQLSGGQQQRVALGRCAVRRPAVLLLDEPLSHLDAPLRAGVRAEILRVRREFGMTAMWVTHDPDEARAVGDRVVEMKAV
jgi:ABC-type sugar transport system ATPase subunit